MEDKDEIQITKIVKNINEEIKKENLYVSEITLNITYELNGQMSYGTLEAHISES